MSDANQLGKMRKELFSKLNERSIIVLQDGVFESLSKSQKSDYLTYEPTNRTGRGDSSYIAFRCYPQLTDIEKKKLLNRSNLPQLMV